MNFFPEEIKKWFGYNRKERRASVMLIILILIVLTVRLVMPGSSMEVIEMTPEVISNVTDTSVFKDPEFIFDPNKASLDTLIRAGLEEREAKTLISYRSKGGRFRKPSDISKIYGLDSVKAQRLAQFIVIEKNNNTGSSMQRPLIELNSCDSAALESLPDIGPVLSARIIRYRNLLGGFVSADQLKEVYGLPAETFDLISKRVTADTSLVKKVDINTADYKSISGLPYLKRYHYTDILKYRELNGEIKGIEELVKNNIIPDSLAVKVRPYVLF